MLLLCYMCLPVARVRQVILFCTDCKLNLNRREIIKLYTLSDDNELNCMINVNEQ